MPLQQKLALTSTIPLHRSHTPGHQNCPACEDIREQIMFGGDISSFMPFAEAAERWVELRELSGAVNRAHFISPRTLRDNRQYIRALNVFFAALRLDEIHAGHFREYQIERNRDAGANKINQELGTLQRILRKAGLWNAELEAGYQPLQVETCDVPRAMSPEEQDRFLAVAATREAWQVVYWYAIVALQTTASNYEMRGLHLADVNLYEQVLQIRVAHAKNKYRVRTIPLTENALWALDRIHQRARALGSVNPGDYLFPFRMVRNIYDPSRPMTESGIKRAFEEIRRAADVPWLRIHDLRHCAITRMAEAGVPLATIMSMAGHISPRMSQHYTQVSEQAKRKALADTYGKSVKAISSARDWKRRGANSVLGTSRNGNVLEG